MLLLNGAWRVDFGAEHGLDMRCTGTHTHDMQYAYRVRVKHVAYLLTYCLFTFVQMR
jgi:hypothetical protein